MCLLLGNMDTACSALPWSPQNLPANLPSSAPTSSGGSYPPGVWPCGPSTVAGDEGGVMLGTLEAVELSSPEGGLGWAGSCHMQPLLHLDPGGRTQVQVVKVGAKLWTGSEGKQGAEDTSFPSGLPWFRPECPPQHPLAQKHPVSMQVTPYSSPPLQDHLRFPTWPQVQV